MYRTTYKIEEQAFTRRLASPARESVMSRQTRDTLAADLWERRQLFVRCPGFKGGFRGPFGTIKARNVIIRRESFRWASAHPEIWKHGCKD